MAVRSNTAALTIIFLPSHNDGVAPTTVFGTLAPMRDRQQSVDFC